MMPNRHNSKLNATSWASAKWIYGFILVQICCQVALIAPLGSARIGFRILTFASSIGMLFVSSARGKRHALRGLAFAVLGIMTLGLLHPQLNSPLAGMGSIAMAAAIWGPIFWVGRYKITPEILSRAIILLWGFHTLSSFVGVLQVYDPERFSPDATFIETLLGEYAEGLKVTLDDGRRIYRPFGLTDSPGGASASGAFAATMGLILAVSKRTMPLRLAGAGSTALGMFCIYICQFRSALIVTCLGFIFMTVLTALRGQGAKAARLSGVIVLAVGAGFLWAVAVGGEAVTNRLETLTNNDTGTVLYKSRGIFLESTFEEEIPAYPLGAGLGRWGMMYTYFGDSNNLDSPAIWVEIQATAWILDGGLMLLLVGYAAVIAACYMAVQMAVRTPSESLSDNAAAIAAMNVGTLVATFGYPVFISQGGIMFWFLNALLYTAVATYKPTALPRSKK